MRTLKKKLECFKKLNKVGSLGSFDYSSVPSFLFVAHSRTMVV